MVDTDIEALGKTTPLHILAGLPNQSVAEGTIRMFFQEGADPNVKNEDGLTPLHVASIWGNYETLKLFLYNGGNANATDNEGQTAEQLAIEHKHEECAKMLRWWTNSVPRTPQQVVGSVSNSPVLLKSPPSSYNPRFFHSPLRETTSNRATPTNEIYTPPAAEITSTRNGIGRRIEFAEENNFNSPIRRNGNAGSAATTNGDDNLSVITKDGVSIASTPDRQRRFVERFERIDVAQLNGSPSKQDRERRRCLTTHYLDISCCCSSSSSSLINPSPPYILNPAEQSTVVAPSVLDNTLTSVNLRRFDEDVEELARILRRSSILDTSRSLDEILEASVRSERNEIENLDPRRLSFCQKLTDQELRARLTRIGFDVGPITNGTRWLYVRRLALHFVDDDVAGPCGGTVIHVKEPKYSSELEKLLQGSLNINEVVNDEAAMCHFFDRDDKQWREGKLKMSFCYLLIDPTITSSGDVNQVIYSFVDVDEESYLRSFVKSVFYVGKGKKSRPFQHLIEAAGLVVETDKNKISNKTEKILQLWKSGEGVISLHIFQNTISAEAYTREAAMIDAIGIENLTNAKRGDYYGLAVNWNVTQRRRLGAYLIKTAALILRLEGRRPLKLNDVIE